MVRILAKTENLVYFVSEHNQLYVYKAIDGVVERRRFPMGGSYNESTYIVEFETVEEAKQYILNETN
jgi:hypothetical protein